MFEHSVQLLGSGQFGKAALRIPGVGAKKHHLSCKVVYARLHDGSVFFALWIERHLRGDGEQGSPLSRHACATRPGRSEPCSRRSNLGLEPAQPIIP
ncbi:MAG: hypothetical protein E2581_04735 [Pseudomonas sp.]|nr:hypothetical protein [Pseudomonas sp.]